MPRKNKKKILVFCHDAVLYGASRSLLDLLSVIVKDPSAEIMVFVPEDGPFVQKLCELNILHKVIPYPRNACFKRISKRKVITVFRRIKTYFFVCGKLYKEVKAFNPEVIYTNTSVIYWGALISYFSLKKHVWHIRELKDQYNIQHDFGLSFFRFLLKRSTYIICNSNAVAKDYRIQKWSHVTVIYNGFPVNKDFKSEKIKERRILTFGMAGAIHPSKGQLEVLKVLTTWKVMSKRDFKIVIAGGVLDNNYYNKIQDFIGHNDLNYNVEFIGFKDEMKCFYSEIDILVCGSLAEAFGRVIIESMIRNIFVIARNTGGIAEIIENRKYGLLYNNEEEFLACLDWFCNNKKRVEEIKQNASEMVSKKFSHESYSSRMMKILFC